MTEELTRAAEEASKACELGIVSHHSEDGWTIETHVRLDSVDGEAPVHVCHNLTPAAALAYLEGLTQGAHIATVRHEALVGAATEARNYFDQPHVKLDGDVVAADLRAALAELDGHDES